MAQRLVPLSNTEKEATIRSLQNGLRLDGRGLLEHREVSVNFGQKYGNCVVSLGETRVMTQVSCEVVEPRPSRPNEGKLVISVHITPMAGPEYEAGRTSDIQDELQQVLESNVRESRCIDLEALCIMAGDSVWQLRADVTVLNACGNLGDACNLSVVAALKHFHRPDVTVEEDGRVAIHDFSEREPIPTFMKKIPVCLTYAFCAPKSENDECELVVFCDPTDPEERIAKGRLVVGLNPHGEITSMNFPGFVQLERKHIKFCVSNAFQRAREVAHLIENAVEEDLRQRKQQCFTKGYADTLESDEVRKRKAIISKVQMMREMSAQLKKVRDFIDNEGVKLESTLGEDDESLERQELANVEQSSATQSNDDLSSEESDTSSEFSEALQHSSLQLDATNTSGTSRVEGTNKISSQPVNLSDDDSEEDIKQTIRL